MKLHNIDRKSLSIRGRNAKIKKQIITAILDAHTVQEAIQEVLALEQSNEKLHEFINRSHIKGDIVGYVSSKV